MMTLRRIGRHPAYAAVIMGVSLWIGEPARACLYPGWTRGNPTIDQEHLFCGEINRENRPSGYHSLTVDPPPTDSVVEAVGPVETFPGGVYRRRVQFLGGRAKLSTFFPDHCTAEAILNSVRYAADHQTGKGRPWGVLGPSAPDAPETPGRYCRTTENKPMILRLGISQRDGILRIHTAFPEAGR